MPVQFWTLVGTLSGVVVGFGLSILRDYLREKRETSRLATALGMEVFILTTTVKQSLQKVKELDERLKRDEPKIRAEFLDKNEPSFYRANLGKLPQLPAKIVMALLLFHELETSLSADAKLMAQRFKDYYSPNPIVTKRELFEQIEHYKGHGQEVVQLGSALLRMIQQKYGPKEAEAWLVETETPGHVGFFWTGKKPPVTHKS